MQQLSTIALLVMALLIGVGLGCDRGSTAATPPKPEIAGAPKPTETPLGDADEGESPSPVVVRPVSDASVAKTVAEPQEITFDTVKFEMKVGDPFERTMLSESIEKLSGNNVRIRGYILPSFRQRGITQFVLVRDNMECCFGPGAALCDSIVVDMEASKSIEYTIRPVAVEGEFTVREWVGPDGKHLAIYHLLGRAVE